MLAELSQSFNFIRLQTQMNFMLLLKILAVFWGCFILTTINRKLLYLGIIPRHVQGIPGIFLSPFLHANFNHLFFNSIPLIVLSDFVLMNGWNYYLLVSVLITIISGFFTWCFAKPGIHLGASGLITGYWSLLVADIFQHGTVTAILLGLISVYYFIGIFYGIFPSKKGVSWEGHLFGLLAGLLVAYGVIPWLTSTF